MNLSVMKKISAGLKKALATTTAALVSFVSICGFPLSPNAWALADWSVDAGDTHAYNVTVNFDEWDETGSVWVYAFYGSSDVEGEPDGYAELGAPGSITLYAPHAEGETEVNFYAAWYADGDSPLLGDGPSSDVSPSSGNPYSLEGAGPTGVIMTVTGAVGGEEDGFADLSASSGGDEHVYHATVNMDGWTEQPIVIAVWYGDTTEGEQPMGLVSMNEGPGVVDVYVPAADGVTQVTLMAFWWESGVIGGSPDYMSSPETLAFEVDGETDVTLTLSPDDEGGGPGSDWSTPTGDDHEVTLTLTTPSWDESGTFYVLGDYGDNLDALNDGPTGLMALDGPGIYSVYVPHVEGQSSAILVVAWYAGEIGGAPDDADYEIISIDGSGPTEVALEIDFSDEGGGEEVEEEVSEYVEEISSITCTDNNGDCIIDSGDPTTIFVDGDDTTGSHISGPNYPIEFEIEFTEEQEITDISISHAAGNTGNFMYLGGIYYWDGAAWIQAEEITNGLGSGSSTASQTISFNDLSITTTRIKIVDQENDNSGGGWWPTEFAFTFADDFEENGEKPGNLVCKTQPAVDDYFYRTKDEDYAHSSQTFGYGVGSVDGEAVYGYGYGYGYQYFCQNFAGWAVDSTNYGAFLAKSKSDDGEASNRLKLSRLKGEGGLVTLPGALPVMEATASSSVKLKMPNALQMKPRLEEWSGELEFDYQTFVSKEALPAKVRDLLKFATTKLASVATGGIAIGLDKAAVIEIPYENFDATKDSVIVIDDEDNEYTANACTEAQYSGALDDTDALSDPDNYTLTDNTNLENPEQCYTYYDGTVYVATNHFTDFVVGEEEESDEEDIPATTVTGGYYINQSNSNNYTSPSEFYPYSENVNYWAVQYVDALLERGVLENPDATSALPNTYVTRAELVKMVVKMMKYSVPESVSYSPFTDVTIGSAYNAYLVVAEANDIVDGYSDGAFRPAQYANRVESLKVLLTAAGLSVDTKYVAPFSDVSQDEWYAKYVNTAAELGLVKGYGNGKFAPANFITYAEVATIIARMTEKGYVK